PLRPLIPVWPHHGQPSRVVLGSWETTRGPSGSKSTGVRFRVKRTTFAGTELFRFWTPSRHWAYRRISRISKTGQFGAFLPEQRATVFARSRSSFFRSDSLARMSSR